MSKDNFESKWRPKCFWESALLTGILLKNILGWIFLVVFVVKMTSWACFVGLRLKLIFHRKVHLFISFRSLFKLLAVISGCLTIENRGMSSANNLGLYCQINHKCISEIKADQQQDHQHWYWPKMKFDR